MLADRRRRLLNVEEGCMLPSQPHLLLVWRHHHHHHQSSWLVGCEQRRRLLSTALWTFFFWIRWIYYICTTTRHTVLYSDAHLSSPGQSKATQSTALTDYVDCNSINNSGSWLYFNGTDLPVKLITKIELRLNDDLVIRTSNQTKYRQPMEHNKLWTVRVSYCIVFGPHLRAN